MCPPQVKACHNVQVTLASRYGDEFTHAYSVQLGYDSNQVSYIFLDKGADESRAQFTTPGILNCQEYRTFWVNWLEGFVSFGSGS